MHRKFDHQAIEQKWQKRWEDSGIYATPPSDTNQEKEYVLLEFPYPSGNLHIGHWFGFAVPDIYVRMRRMQGKRVFFPIGFDAFGLPAENAAIKHNLNPKEWTDANIAHMTDQLRSMGNAFSWDALCRTSDPEYYRWTQWMFTQFFEKGLAYQGVGVVNWCPSCNTVLANEQVVNAACERCGAVVLKKEMLEWKLRITEYADRLIDDLEELDWPEAIKESQRRWIGRSAGAKISFKLSTGETLEVFTTRPDTLFGVTYMVLAPEHPLVEQYKDIITNWADVEAYVAATRQKDEQDRLDDTKEKTGVKLEGVTATNPANGAKVPVYIADYVLAGYGTGAIMAVPAHDERDFAFAKKFELPVISVVYQDGGEIRPTSNMQANPGSGRLKNSGEFDGMNSEEAKKTITEKVGGTLTNTYRLRDWSVGRQRYWGVPIPIVYDPEGKPHAVPQEHLPWLLPTDVDFRPTGEPPLAKSAELKERTEKIFGAGWRPAVETLDTFVDSSWFFLRYLDPHTTETFATLEHQKDWMPIDLYFGGAEHTTMHLLYSRFWQKALFDLCVVTAAEPYTRRINRGLVLGPDGNKMSKSKGNVIDPDEQVKRLGADTVKMYLAFMGPYGEVTNYPWDLGGIAGIRRFLERAYGLTDHIAESEPETTTRLLHKTIDKVFRDINAYKFNTAISALMVFVNHVEKEGVTDDSYAIFLRLLAPFAPHLAEELWEMAGNTTSVHQEAWPQADSALLTEDTVTIGVQINGKHRGEIAIAANASEEEAFAAAKANTKIQERLTGEVRKIIYVPGRILNIIV